MVIASVRFSPNSCLGVFIVWSMIHLRVNFYKVLIVPRNREKRTSPIDDLAKNELNINKEKVDLLIYNCRQAY